MLRKSNLVYVLVGLILFLAAVSVGLQLDFPNATGPFPVGRTVRHWVNSSRLETLGSTPGRQRETPVIIWYPAEKSSAAPAAYFPDLDLVANDLVASGQVASWEVLGLRFIKSSVHTDPPMAGLNNSYPVIVLSPGNGTNVEFYTGIAEELASQGYIVVGINHPFDVAAVALHDGTIARFDEGPIALQERLTWVSNRIAVRVQDVLFVLNQLKAANNVGDQLLSGRMDLANVGVIGHSLGGITAAQACLAEKQFSACLNIDGLQRGGPFSVDANPVPPGQPFMFLTKEQTLPPASLTLFKTIPGGSFRVVIPTASHDNFTDGPLLTPGLLPLPNASDRILALYRSYSLAFFDQTLKHQPSALLSKSTQNGQVTIDVYPSE